MAEEKKTEEREYIIPLRKEWRKVANYRRTGRAVKAIKQFIAKHMRVPDRDVSKVKLDIYLNQEVWFRGRKKPPAKIKVRVKKEGENFVVQLAELPAELKFKKLKDLKKHMAAAKEEKGVVKKPEEKKEEKKEEKSEGEKSEEKEKIQATAELKAKEAKIDAKTQKAMSSKSKETPIHRMALKK